VPERRSLPRASDAQPQRSRRQSRRERSTLPTPEMNCWSVAPASSTDCSLVRGASLRETCRRHLLFAGVHRAVGRLPTRAEGARGDDRRARLGRRRPSRPRARALILVEKNLAIIALIDAPTSSEVARSAPSLFWPLLGLNQRNLPYKSRTALPVATGRYHLVRSLAGRAAAAVVCCRPLPGFFADSELTTQVDSHRRAGCAVTLR